MQHAQMQHAQRSNLRFSDLPGQVESVPSVAFIVVNFKVVILAIYRKMMPCNMLKDPTSAFQIYLVKWNQCQA